MAVHMHNNQFLTFVLININLINEYSWDQIPVAFHSCQFRKWSCALWPFLSACECVLNH